MKEEEAIGQAVIIMQKSCARARAHGQDVHELIKHKYGKNLSNGSLYRLLHCVGLSWITGRSIYPKGNVEQAN